MSILSVLSRKLAMFHAGRNFNHQVQERKEKNHQLVTSGIKVSSFCFHHCCGSGSGNRGLFDPWIRDLGWVKNQDPDPG
jgi:hypothetical protein